jgi:hypothetical protein
MDWEVCERKDMVKFKVIPRAFSWRDWGETRKPLNHDHLSLDRDSNSGPPEYEVKVQTAPPRRWVLCSNFHFYTKIFGLNIKNHFSLLHSLYTFSGSLRSTVHVPISGLTCIAQTGLRALETSGWVMSVNVCTGRVRLSMLHHITRCLELHT